MFVKPHPERTVLLGHGPAGDKGPGDEIRTPMAVLNPHTRAPMPREGMDVPEDAYWMRRLRDGDVVRAEPPTPDQPAQAEEHVQ